MRDQVVRTQGEAPPRGGGRQPLEGDQHSFSFFSRDYAWNEAAIICCRGSGGHRSGQHQIWVIAARIRPGCSGERCRHEVPKSVDGRKMTESRSPSQEQGRRLRERSYVIERIESWYGLPWPAIPRWIRALAATAISRASSFPPRSFSTRRQPGVGFSVTAVRVNLPVNIETPENVRSDPTPVKVEKAADGVWYITGARIIACWSK